MTIKEMLKKIENYNEMAEIVGGEKLELRMVFEYGLSDEVKSYKEFSKYIRDEFIDEIAKPILEYKGYEFHKEYVIERKTKWGDVVKEVVTFFPAIA